MNADKLYTVFLTIAGLFQLLIYPLALYKWFISSHTYFWAGAKELLWGLCPIANFFYVWEEVLGLLVLGVHNLLGEEAITSLAILLSILGYGIFLYYYLREKK